MKSLASWSIRTHIILLVILASLPAFCILIDTGLEQQREASRAMDRMSAGQASSLANLQERTVADTRQLLTVVAELPQVKRMEAKACNEILAGLLRQNPNYDNLIIAATDGRFYASGLPLFAHSASDRRYFQEALRTQRFSAGEFVIARNSNLPAIHFSLPVLDAAQHVQQVLVAGLNIARLDQIFDRTNMAPGSSFVLLDHRGLLLRKYPAATADAGTPFPGWPAGGCEDGKVQLKNSNGNSTVYACRNLRLPGAASPYMTVLVNSPESPSLAAARRKLWHNLLLLSAATLLATACALAGGSLGIVRPLRRLVAATRTLAEGQPHPPLNLNHAPVELTQLASAFDALASASAAKYEAERALKESEARYQGLFMNSPDCIFWIRVQDGGFIVESINPAQEAASGLAGASMVGNPLPAFLPAAYAQAREANYRLCVQERQSITYEDKVDFMTGCPVYQTLLVPLLDPQGEVARMVGISRDITQLKTAEAALRQSQKLESLGVLAGGIAHDFNNLLTAILGNLDLAVYKLAPDSPALSFLKMAERTSLKASELTRQMLAYSGKGRFVVEPHDLNHLVEEVTHLLKVSISKKAVIKYQLTPGLPAFEADSAQIQQVVMNLVTNASEAIADAEGIISLSTSAMDLDAHYIDSTFPTHNLQPGRYVVLEVADTGCGMSPAVQGRIFDPFYTTKVSGRGLGLSAMLGILRGHKAGIKIYSEAGIGSTFRVFFPASSTALPLAPAAPTQEAPALRGTVLLVDDENIILATLTPALETMGFKVITARDGMEAVDRFRAAHASIDLVLMDLTMPRMNGREAFQAMRLIQKDVRVILTSGYNEQESLQNFIGKGLAGFIQKPFLLKDLRKVIQANLAT